MCHLLAQPFRQINSSVGNGKVPESGKARATVRRTEARLIRSRAREVLAVRKRPGSSSSADSLDRLCVPMHNLSNPIFMGHDHRCPQTDGSDGILSAYPGQRQLRQREVWTPPATAIFSCRLRPATGPE
jgi:hypothetical protein